LLTETQRPVTATALEPSTVIRIPRTLFLKMLEGYPEAALRLRDSFITRAEHSESDMHRVRRVLEENHSQSLTRYCLVMPANAGIQYTLTLQLFNCSSSPDYSRPAIDNNCSGILDSR